MDLTDIALRRIIDGLVALPGDEMPSIRVRDELARVYGHERVHALWLASSNAHAATWRARGLDIAAAVESSVRIAVKGSRPVARVSGRDVRVLLIDPSDADLEASRALLARLAIRDGLGAVIVVGRSERVREPVPNR